MAVPRGAAIGASGRALPSPIATVLFDLDGTLTDPKPGIVGAIRHAMAELGRPLVPEADLDWCIGPPLAEIFTRLFDGDASRAAEGIAAYRARYGVTGLFENTVYAGIPELLTAARGRGQRIVLATSKPRVYAQRILDHFDLTRFFDAVHGAELDGTRAAKTDLVPWIVAKEAIDPAAAVMVGDREHDVIGATAADIPTVGVAWGYGGRAELEGAGAVRVVDTVAELAAVLGAA